MSLRLAQVAEVRLGRQRAPQYEQGEHLLPYLRSANVVDGHLDLTDVKSMNFAPAEQAIFGLADGDVLMTEGSGSAETVGTSAVWRTDLPGTVCFQNTLLRLRPRAGVTDGRFLAWWARHAHASGQIAAVSTGANIQHIGSDGLKDLSIHVPQIEEQRRIADFLDDRVARFDRIITARRTQMALIGDACRAQLQDLHDGLAATYGSTRLGRALRGLEQGWSPQAEAVTASLEEWGVMRAGCVNGGVFREADNKRLPDGLEPETRYEIHSGDLLMSRASGSLDLIGSVAVVPESVRGRLLLCDKVYRLFPDAGWSPNFLSSMLRTHKNRELIRLGVSGAEGMANNLPSGVIRGLVVPNVPSDSQDVNATIASGVESQARAGAARLATSAQLLQEYKQSLITAAVTGEIDVTTAASGIPG